MFNRKKNDKQKEKDIIKNPYIKGIVSFNTQYCSISKYSDSTVLRTPDSVLKGSLYSKENRFSSEEYLLNYKSNNNNLGYRAGLSNFFQQNATITATNKYLEENLDDAIILPKHKNIKAPLGAVIKSRRSVRKYKKNNLSFQELSNILYYAQGISDESETFIKDENLKLRNTPSAGGLYPVSLYFYLNNVEEVQNGFYVYYPYTHSIKPINLQVKNTDINNFADLSNISCENVNLFFVYVYNMYINSRKYGDIGAAFAFIEAGEIAQNIQLTSTAIGYGSCDIGGYEKRYLEKLLKLDGLTNHIIHMTLVGKEGV